MLLDREQKMEELYDQIEREAVILGATAIEDKLQDEVGNSLYNRDGIYNCFLEF